MTLGFEHPWVLALLTLAVLPFVFSGATPTRYSWLELIPADVPSRVLGAALRAAGALAIASLVVALSGSYRGEQHVERISEGAQIVIVLDRSRSMNDSFAGRTPTAQGEESKAQAASRLLLDFIRRRPNNVYGVVEFTSAPIFTLPLTTKLEAVRAAIKPAAQEGLALTNIASPLAMAAAFYEGRAYQGSRVILLVSDGAAKIDDMVGGALRDSFQDYNVRLYWIYIRSKGSPGMYGKPDEENAVFGGVPEQALNRYFKSLNIPYIAYEADDPGALQRAVSDMDQLERWPLRTVEVLPRQDLSGYFYALSMAMIIALVLAKLVEVSSWR